MLADEGANTCHSHANLWLIILHQCLACGPFLACTYVKPEKVLHGLLEYYWRNHRPRRRLHEPKDPRRVWPIYSRACIIKRPLTILPSGLISTRRKSFCFALSGPFTLSRMIFGHTSETGFRSLLRPFCSRLISRFAQWLTSFAKT